MTLTEKQRDEAAMLLRCGADLLVNHGEPFPMLVVAGEVAAEHDAQVATVYAREAIRGPRDQWKLLRAAALLEDGWNPGDPVERLP